MKSTRQGRAKPARNASRIRRKRSPRDGVSGRNPRSVATKREPARRRSHYQTLFENLRQGAFYQRADGVLLDVNPAALELFGLTRKEFLRRTSEDPEWKVIREDGSPFPGVEHPSVLALRTGRAVRNAVAGVFNPRRNTYVWLEINAIPEFRRGEKKPYQVLVTLHDITERKAAENALRETNARLAAVFEGTQDAIFVADTATGRIVDANPGAARLLRRSRESILGMHQSELHPPQEAERYRQQFSRRAGQTAPRHTEGDVWTSDGRRVPVEISASTITLASGPRAMVGIFRDISDRKRADGQARQDAQRTELLLDLHQRAPQMTDRELYDYVLEKAVALTDSAIGFFHQVSEDQKTIILTTWNQEALKNCTAAFDSHYPLGEAGNWVDCVRQQRPVIYNDFAHSPNQKGLPAGHAPVRRFMSIPVVEEGKVRIIFGVGNKVVDYDDQDVAQLQLVANELHKIMAQRRSEEALRESEANLRALLAASTQAILLLDAQGGVIEINEIGAARLGLRREDVRGTNVYAHLPPKELTAHQACLDQIVRSGQPLRFEDTRSGHVLDQNLVPIFNDAGQVVRVAVFAEDITERKQAEAALRESEERFRALVTASSDVVYRMSADWTEMRHLTGRDFIADTLEPSQGWLRKYIPPGDQSQVRAVIDKAIRTKSLFELEHRVLRVDGSLGWTQSRAVPILDANGKILEWFGMASDATIRKEAERALHESEEFRQAVFDSMAAHIAVVNQAGVILAVNTPWERFRNANSPAEGAPVGECGLGEDYLEVCRRSAEQGAEGAMTAGEGIRSVLAGQAASFTMEYPCHAPTEQRWFSMTVTPLGGGQRGAVVTHTNITALKQAGQALAGSKARLEAVFRVAPTGVGVVVDRVLQEVNDRILEMTGYLREELVGGNARLLYPTEEDFLFVGREKYRQIAERGTGTVESRWRRKDGAIRDVLLSSTPLDPADHSRGVVFTALDITERKQAQEALRASEAKWRSYLENAPVGVLVADAEGRHIEANREAEVMLGYEPGGMLGTHFSDLPVEQSHEAAARHFAEVAGGECSDGQFQLRRKDGGRIWASVRAAKIASDRFLAVIQDITERVRSEESVRKLSQAVEQSPASVIITDLKGNTEYVNRRFCELTGYSAAEMVGQNPRLLKSGQTPQEVYRQLWATITQGDDWDGEMLNRKKNGELFWERALISPIKDAGGRITHYLGLKEDITERKRAEAELRASREQLRALATSLTRAEQRERRRIATLLHDDVIQSLALTRIKLGALRAQLVSAEQQTLLDSIRPHLEGAINSTRSMTFQLSPPILHELGLEAALGWLAEQFSHEHDIRCEYVADSPPVSLNEETRNLLFAATRELLVNVIKHARATCARVTTQTDGGLLRVVVEDDGVGCRPDSTAGPNVKTGGFGLFSIRERLSYLGGHCDVQSAPARGTRVTLTMPLKKA